MKIIPSFYVLYSGLLFLVGGQLNTYAQNNCATFEPFTFGVIADCQCGSLDCNSVPKLEEAVNYFNSTDITFCVHLGDFIMNGYQNYNPVQPIYESLNAPHYYVLGNHEWDIPDTEKPGLVERLNMPNYYYDLKVKNFRFIFIESSELAFFNESAHPQLVNERDSIYGIYGGSQGCGGISKSQLTYIDATIALAAQNLENVVLFGHHPIYPPSPNRNVWNDVELINTLEKYTNVVAYMNGHKHEGDYDQKNGIHYVTYKAMLSHTNSYSLIEVVQDTLKVKGFGEADNYALKFAAKIAILDDDEDNVCNADDVCPWFDDNLIGTICDDNDTCTLNDVYTINCNCVGIYTDSDGDGVCDTDDTCPGFDDNLASSNCDDNDRCTLNDIYTINCDCAGTYIDSDNDGVCDANDLCPNYDDTIDTDNDNIPDACDDCFDFFAMNNNDIITSGIYNAANFITSNSKIVTQSNITFNAGDSIILAPGFEVEIKASFEAFIKGCIN